MSGDSNQERTPHVSNSERTIPESKDLEEVLKAQAEKSAERHKEISATMLPDDIPDQSGKFGPFACSAFSGEGFDDRVIIGENNKVVDSEVTNRDETKKTKQTKAAGRSVLGPGVVVTTHGPIAFPEKHLKELWVESDYGPKDEDTNDREDIPSDKPDPLIDYNEMDDDERDQYDEEVNYEMATLYLDLRQWAPSIHEIETDDNDDSEDEPEYKLINRILPEDVDKYYKWAPCKYKPGPWSESDNLLLGGKSGYLDLGVPHHDVIILAHVIATKTYHYEDSDEIIPRQIVGIFGTSTEVRINAAFSHSPSTVLAKITGGPDDGGLYDAEFFEAGYDGPQTGQGKVEMLNSNLSEQIPKGTKVVAHKIVSSITDSQWESDEENEEES